LGPRPRRGGADCALESVHCNEQVRRPFATAPLEGLVDVRGKPVRGTLQLKASAPRTLVNVWIGADFVAELPGALLQRKRLLCRLIETVISNPANHVLALDRGA
jgi:hypothetical protein